MATERLSARAEGAPLEDYDPALYALLTSRLVDTLTSVYLKSPDVAKQLAETVRWSVERDEKGLWMTMTLPDGTYSAVGGEWTGDDKALLPYVDDLALTLNG